MTWRTFLIPPDTKRLARQLIPRNKAGAVASEPNASPYADPLAGLAANPVLQMTDSDALQGQHELERDRPVA